MADPASRKRLVDGLDSLGLAVDDHFEQALLAYLDELARWNRAYNLSAVRDPESMVTRHLLDSLVMLPVVDARPMVQPALLDVGAGAGLPGVVLAICRPELEVTVLDSNGKKARFLRHVQRALALDNLAVIEARVEQLEGDQRWPLITSRAFTALDRFIRLTMPLLADGGRWLAMKGRWPEQGGTELPAGVKIEAVQQLFVPGLDAQRHIVTVAREDQT